MSAVSTSSFTYSGGRYVLGISLSDYGYKVKEQLADSSIVRFQFSSNLKQLYLTADLEYVDSFGQVDKFIDRRNVIADVTFCQIDYASDGDFSNESIKNRFEHKFFVDSMEILGREGNKISYKIHMVSIFRHNHYAVWDFSNYGTPDNDPERKSLGIIRKCLSDYGMTVGTSLSTEVTSGVSMKYITGGNDTLDSVCDYVLSHEFYETEDKVKDLKFLYYDWVSSTVECLDLGVKGTIKRHRDVMVAFFNDEIESKLYQDPVNFGTINARDNSDFFMGNFQRTIYKYDKGSNEIEQKTISSGDLVDFFNGKLDSITTPSLNTGNHKPPENVKFVNKMSYWNNDLDLYDEITSNLLQDNALTLNVVGDLMFRLGGVV